jgi:predicted DNA-binding protein with PD1-like motif
MDSKLLYEEDGQRVFAVVLAAGEEVLASLGDFVGRHRIGAAQLTAVGAFSDVVLKYFDWETKQYRHIPVDEQVEVASLIGDVALDPEGNPVLHIHVVVGRRDGSAKAGHLGQAHVRPTLEVIINESPAYLQKSVDPSTGLPLIHPSAPVARAQ